MKEKLRKNLDQVIWNIEQARIEVSEHHIVKLIAVGKYSDEASIETLYSLGQRAFGENHVQQLSERMERLDHLPLEWHMIGPLQSNKINKLLDLHPSLFQALDSLKLAEALNKRLVEREQTLNVLLQVNAAAEANKSGVRLDEAIDTYQQIQEQYPNIKLKGIMSIGAHTDDRKTIQKSFEETHDVYEKLQKEGATICSMGMSGDYELAIRCGANLVRVGSKIFA